MDRYKVTWTSHNIGQQAIIMADSVAEAKMKVKRRNPHGEYKNMTAVKMK